MPINHPTVIETYNDLPPLEKKLLQILSIAYAKMTQTQLLACLVVLDIRTEDGQPFDSGTRNAMFKHIRNPLDALLKGDLLHGKSRSILLVNRGYIEVLTRYMTADKKFAAMAGTLQQTLGLTEAGFSQEPSLSMDQLMAGMRIFYYQDKVPKAIGLYERFITRVSDKEAISTVWKQISDPFDPGWFQRLPPDIHTSLLGNSYQNDIEHWRQSDSRGEYLESLVMEGSSKCESDLEAAVLEKWMFTGQQDRLRTWLKKFGKKSEHLENSLCLQGWMAFCRGAMDKSISFYEKALDLLKKRTNGRKKFSSDGSWAYFIS